MFKFLNLLLKPIWIQNWLAKSYEIYRYFVTNTATVDDQELNQIENNDEQDVHVQEEATDNSEALEVYDIQLGAQHNHKSHITTQQTTFDLSGEKAEYWLQKDDPFQLARVDSPKDQNHPDHSNLIGSKSPTELDHLQGTDKPSSTQKNPENYPSTRVRRRRHEIPRIRKRKTRSQDTKRKRKRKKREELAKKRSNRSSTQRDSKVSRTSSKPIHNSSTTQAKDSNQLYIQKRSDFHSASCTSFLFQDYVKSLEDLIEIQQKTVDNYQKFMNQFKDHYGEDDFNLNELDAWWFNLNRTQNYVMEHSIAKRSTSSDLLAHTPTDNTSQNVNYQPHSEIALSHLPTTTGHDTSPLLEHSHEHTHLHDPLDATASLDTEPYTLDSISDNSYEMMNGIDHEDLSVESDTQSMTRSSDSQEDVSFIDDTEHSHSIILSESDLQSHPSIDFITFTPHSYDDIYVDHLSDDVSSHSWSYNDSFDQSQNKQSYDHSESYSKGNTTYRLKLKKSSRKKRIRHLNHSRSLSHSIGSESQEFSNVTRRKSTENGNKAKT